MPRLTRSAFLLATAGVVLDGLPARATGGLDVAEPSGGRDVRVLLSSDSSVSDARPIDARTFQWRGRTYRGRPETVSFADGRLGLVDVVPLEGYLYGVVSRELAPGWPSASLQAQAIVARTYTIGKLRPGKTYDVFVGEGDQLYGGFDAEAPSVNFAVDATAGRRGDLRWKASRTSPTARA